MRSSLVLSVALSFLACGRLKNDKDESCRSYAKNYDGLKVSGEDKPACEFDDATSEYRCSFTTDGAPAFYSVRRSYASKADFALERTPGLTRATSARYTRNMMGCGYQSVGEAAIDVSYTYDDQGRLTAEQVTAVHKGLTITGERDCFGKYPTFTSTNVAINSYSAFDELGRPIAGKASLHNPTADAAACVDLPLTVSYEASGELTVQTMTASGPEVCAEYLNRSSYFSAQGDLLAASGPGGWTTQGTFSDGIADLRPSSQTESGEVCQ